MNTKEAEAYLESIGGRLGRDSDGMAVGFRLQHGHLALQEANAILQIPQMRHIEVDGCHISDTFLDNIGSNDRITLIEMNKCGLDDSSLKRLSRSSVSVAFGLMITTRSRMLVSRSCPRSRNSRPSTFPDVVESQTHASCHWASNPCWRLLTSRHARL